MLTVLPIAMPPLDTILPIATTTASTPMAAIKQMQLLPPKLPTSWKPLPPPLPAPLPVPSAAVSLPTSGTSTTATPFLIGSILTPTPNITSFSTWSQQIPSSPGKAKSSPSPPTASTSLRTWPSAATTTPSPTRTITPPLKAPSRSRTNPLKQPSSLN